MASFCSIVTGNYVPQALVLYESILQTNELDAFYLFIVENKNKKFDFLLSSPKLHLLFWEDFVTEELKEMAIWYTPFQLSNALKPFCIEFLLIHYPIQTIVYLDADIQVYHSFSSILDQVKDSSFGLTPHCLYPIPPTFKKPNDLEIACFGLFNGGCWIVNRNVASHRMLHFFKERLLTFYKNKEIGLVADQTLLNLLPIYFEGHFTILRHPGLNVAYWNLHERKVKSIADTFYVNDQPLLFFHFSGFQTTNMRMFSKYSAIQISGKDMEQLFEGYAKELSKWRLKLNDYLSDYRYTFGMLGNVRLTKEAREYYFNYRKLDKSNFFFWRKKILFILSYKISKALILLQG